MKNFIIFFLISLNFLQILSGGPKGSEPSETIPPPSPETTTETEATTIKSPPPFIPECFFQTTISNKIVCVIHVGSSGKEASNACHELSGKLFVIETEEEKNALSQWLYDTWGSAYGLIYRINGFKESDQWVTDDGEPLAMASIPPESPDNGNCLQFEGYGATKTFYVRSSNCQTGRGFICQIPY